MLCFTVLRGSQSTVGTTRRGRPPRCYCATRQPPVAMAPLTVHIGRSSRGGCASPKAGGVEPLILAANHIIHRGAPGGVGAAIFGGAQP